MSSDNMPLVIKNGHIVLPHLIIDGSIVIEGEKITSITSSAHLPPDAKVIDAEGKFVLAGGIDVHAHIHDVNYTHREDFKHGSIASAAGGITTFINMPLDTDVISAEEIQNLRKLGESMSIVDFGLHAGNMSECTINKVPEAIANGIFSFKGFTCPPYHLAPSVFEELMTVIKKHNGLLMVHSEDYEILTYLEEKLRKENKKSIFDYLNSRPAIAEAEAIRRVVYLARTIGVKLHIVHVSSKLGAEAIVNAKKSNVDISAETCPQYLLLTRDVAKKWGPYVKMNPVIKTEVDNAALWRALKNGTIDMITTDHAPVTKEEKEIGNQDIWKAGGGVPGIETVFPILLFETLVNKRLSLRRLTEVISLNPAKRFNLFPKKGIIAVNSDADLVIIDPKNVKQISIDDLHYKCGWSVYEDFFSIPMDYVISRGEIIFEKGEVLGKPGRGEFLPTTGNL